MPESLRGSAAGSSPGNAPAIEGFRAPPPVIETPVSRIRESTFRPAVLLMAGRALASIATLLIPVTLVRVFDQSEYGTYKQLFLVFTTLSQICFQRLERRYAIGVREARL